MSVWWDEGFTSTPLLVLHIYIQLWGPTVHQFSSKAGWFLNAWLVTVASQLPSFCSPIFIILLCVYQPWEFSQCKQGISRKLASIDWSKRKESCCVARHEKYWLSSMSVGMWLQFAIHNSDSRGAQTHWCNTLPCTIWGTFLWSFWQASTTSAEGAGWCQSGFEEFARGGPGGGFHPHARSAKSCQRNDQ